MGEGVAQWEGGRRRRGCCVCACVHLGLVMETRGVEAPGQADDGLSRQANCRRTCQVGHGNERLWVVLAQGPKARGQAGQEQCFGLGVSSGALAHGWGRERTRGKVVWGRERHSDSEIGVGGGKRPRGRCVWVREKPRGSGPSVLPARLFMALQVCGCPGPSSCRHACHSQGEAWVGGGVRGGGGGLRADRKEVRARVKG